jgi:hypothetical protein
MNLKCIMQIVLLNAHDNMQQKVSVQVKNLDEGDHVIHDDVGI